MWALQGRRRSGGVVEQPRVAHEVERRAPLQAAGHHQDVHVAADAVQVGRQRAQGPEHVDGPRRLCLVSDCEEPPHQRGCGRLGQAPDVSPLAPSATARALNTILMFPGPAPAVARMTAALWR